MSDARDLSDLSGRLHEAAAWRVRLSDVGSVSTPEFEAWLAAPGSAEAWAQVQAPWDYLGALADDPDLLAARHAALRDAKTASLSRRPTPLWRSALAVAAALLLVIGGWGAVVWLQAPVQYSTDFGERRVVTLSDGSRISLDSKSQVSVAYSRTARELHLWRGQARFDVSHDVERPFSVIAGDSKVIATGTAFNIDVTDGRVVVALIQGHVVVLPEDKAPDQPARRAIELNAGQQVIAIRSRPPQVAAANIQRAIAWTSGQMIFDNETLSEVVARVNRYSNSPIVIGDAKIASLRLSGVFNSDDVPGFIDTVTHYLPVEAKSDESGRTMLTSKE